MPNSSLLSEPEEYRNLAPTLNQMGYMVTKYGKYYQDFIDYSAICSHKVLDIGAAFGNVTIPALKKGATVIANDLDQRHLNLLKAGVEPRFYHHLELRAAKFPQELELQSGSLGAVFAGRVLHFLTGEELIEGINKIYDWLLPGGKFIAVACTPYGALYKDFYPIYQERVKQGVKWPGFIEDTSMLTSCRKEEMPPFFHLIDEEAITELLTDVGFVIQELDFLAADGYPADMSLDGRETLGLIAVKP